jgi:hypothetical protein
MEVGGRVVEQEFLVVDNVKTDCVLGIDFLCEQGIVLNAKTKSLMFDAPETVAPSISLEKSLKLAPRTAKTVKAKVENLKEGTTVNGEWLFHPNSPLSMEGIVKIQENNGMYTVVEIENDSDFPLTIESDESLGFLQVVQEGNLDEITSVRESYPKSESKLTQIGRKISTDVDLSKLPTSVRSHYVQLLKSYYDVFSLNTYDVGHTNILPQDITLKDPSKIACTPPYRIPEHLRPVAHEYINNLARAGIIQRSMSPFSSPLMLVRKGDAKPEKPLVEQYRVVHDYRRLNENTVRDSYPMRNLYELLDSVAQAKVWSVIDLSSGFWNQHLSSKSRPFTAFGLPGAGHWEYTRSAQGLTNSPAAFQRLLDHVLEGIAGVYVYIDDVIICSEDHKSHLAILTQVFQRFRKYKLKCKLSKLQLGAGEVNYLGYNISRSHGIRAGAAKIAAVSRWSHPTSVTEIKQFLGLCSFFRRTIPNFAEIASPLSKLTRKDAKWDPPTLPLAAKEAFISLQKALCARPCLAPVNFDREFILTTDASGVGLGAILSQQNEFGKEHPCAYASRTLTEAEQKWAPTMLEHLAMVWGCRHFKPYLAGKHFRLRTDHQPLVSLNRVQGNVLQRMNAELDDYRPFTVEYLKGTSMPADALSRLGIAEVEARKLPNAISTDQLFYMQKQDKFIKSLVVWLKYNQMPRDENLAKYVLALKNHAELHRGVAYFKRGSERLGIVPESLKPTVLYHAHDSPLAGHRAFRPTLEKIQENWYWPGMDAEVEVHCKQCSTCLAVNQAYSKRPVPMGKLQTVTHFNERVHVDLLGWLPVTEGQKFLLVLQDAHSKWVELAPLPDKSSESTVTAIMKHWIGRHGCMHTIVSDQGKEFVNKIMAELCGKLHIGHQTTSAMHPQSNGLVERTNRTILSYLRKHLEGSNDWVSQLSALQFSLNTAVHSSTGHSPFQLVYGRRPVIPLSLQDPDSHSKYKDDAISQQLRLQANLQQAVWQAEEEAWAKQKAQFDKRSKSKKVKPGDMIYLNRPHDGKQFQKFQPLFKGPFQVIDLLRNDNILIKSISGKTTNVHLNRVKMAPFAEQLFDSPDGPDEIVSTPRTHVSKTEPIDPNLIPPELDDGGADDPMVAPPPAQANATTTPLENSGKRPRKVKFNPNVTEPTRLTRRQAEKQGLKLDWENKMGGALKQVPTVQLEALWDADGEIYYDSREQ